jgi:hypothetical protein
MPKKVEGPVTKKKHLAWFVYDVSGSKCIRGKKWWFQLAKCEIKFKTVMAICILALFIYL